MNTPDDGFAAGTLSGEKETSGDLVLQESRQNRKKQEKTVASEDHRRRLATEKAVG